MEAILSGNASAVPKMAELASEVRSYVAFSAKVEMCACTRVCVCMCLLGVVLDVILIESTLYGVLITSLSHGVN